MHGFIYAIHNELSGKVYVGQTIRCRVERRWYEHRLTLSKGRGTNRHLQSAWTHYGATAFRFECLEQVDASTAPELKERLTQREGAWMSHYARQGRTLYNAQAAGDSTAYLRRGQPSPKRGVPMSEAQRQKLAASLQGNTRRRGTQTSDVGRANISAGRKGQPSPKRGKPASPAHKAALDAIAQRRTGSTHSAATRSRMRESAKGRTWTLVDGKRVYSKPTNEEARA